MLPDENASFWRALADEETTYSEALDAYENYDEPFEDEMVEAYTMVLTDREMDQGRGRTQRQAEGTVGLR